MSCCPYCKSRIHQELDQCIQGKQDVEKYRAAIAYILCFIQRGDILLLSTVRAAFLRNYVVASHGIIPPNYETNAVSGVISEHACRDIVKTWVQTDLERKSPAFNTLYARHHTDNAVMLPLNDAHIQIPLSFLEDYKDSILISSHIRVREDLRGIRYAVGPADSVVRYSPIRFVNNGIWRFEPTNTNTYTSPIIKQVNTTLVHTEDCCSICLTTTPSMKTQCGHSFCTCILTHLSNHDSCPMCRKVVQYIEVNKE